MTPRAGRDREMLAASGGRVVREDRLNMRPIPVACSASSNHLELRMDGAQLQVRSSSRVGYSDSANAARVADLRARLMVAFAGIKP